MNNVRLKTGNLTMLRDNSGSISIMMAFLIFVICGITGLSLDFAMALRYRSILQASADAAVLAAGSDPNVSDGEAKRIVKSYLALNSALDSKKITYTIKRTGEAITLEAKMKVETSFMRVLGHDKLDISVHSTAGLSRGESEVYAVIDMSSSLGIAADKEARARMIALTKPYTAGGCEFACHRREGWEPAGKTAYQMAKAAGIPMREDVLKSAFGKFVDSYMPDGDAAVAQNLKRMSVIGFSDSAKMLARPTNSTSTIKNAPDLFPDYDRWNTKYKIILPQVKTMVGQQGTGFNGIARKTVLLITDGMGWNRSGPGYNGAIDVSLCDSFKAEGISVAVIEVKYLDASGEFNFDTYVKWLYPPVSPALVACASPGLHFLANDSDAASLATAFEEAAVALQTRLILVN